eukprot:4520993-Pyramimonas_sp.AAC.1
MCLRGLLTIVLTPYSSAPHCTYLPPVMWVDDVTEDDAYDPLAVHFEQMRGAAHARRYASQYGESPTLHHAPHFGNDDDNDEY